MLAWLVLPDSPVIGAAPTGVKVGKEEKGGEGEGGIVRRGELICTFISSSNSRRFVASEKRRVKKEKKKRRKPGDFLFSYPHLLDTCTDLEKILGGKGGGEEKGVKKSLDAPRGLWSVRQRGSEKKKKGKRREGRGNGGGS